MQLEANHHPILHTKSLAVGYGKRAAEALFQGLDLELKTGALTCLLGSNGSGKSTLLRTLAGLQPSLAGEVLFKNDPRLIKIPAKRAKTFAVVLTERRSAGLLRVNEFVALGRYPHTKWTGSFDANDFKTVAWAIDCVSAGALRERFLHTLSDGEYQRVVLARALAQETPLILLDEPTAFLDLPHRVEIMQILKNLVKDCGLTLLMSIHDLDLALEYADQFWLMDSNGNFECGFPEDLLFGGQVEACLGDGKVFFDRDRGAFHPKQIFTKNVRLSGEPSLMRWTRSILAKNGYGIEAEAPVAHVEASFDPESGKPLWSFRVGDSTRRISSFENLSHWVATMDASNSVS